MTGRHEGASDSRRAQTPTRPHSHTPTREAKRRWFTFGPGLAIALILSGFILYTRWDDSRQRQAPRVERTVIGGGSGKPGEGIAPDIATLLARRDALGLSQRQVRDLERLRAEWERVSAGRRREAAREAAEFRGWMSGAQKQKVTRLDDIQEHGAALSALSAALFRQRRAYWQSAQQILTAEQRERARRLGASGEGTPRPL